MPVVLILDDRVTNRNIYSRLAASVGAGVTVQAFGDAEEALDWIERNPVDLIITDYKMPRMDGSEFVRRVRAKPPCVDVPIVVITAYNDRSYRLSALEAGATDFLLSPADRYEFTTRVRNLLELRRQQLLVKQRAHTLERELERSERSREALLRNSREALAQVIDTVPAMISATDRDGRCVFVNAYHAALAGATPNDLVGHDPGEPFGRAHAERSRALDRLVFQSAEPLPSYEEEVLDANGVRRVFLTTKAPLRDAEGTVVSVLTTALDITDRKLAESRLRHLAHHDGLTDLPNRVLLRERLQRELARGRRGGRGFALHILDLDRFKAVNDALGHHLGDRLLCQVADRLRALARTGDTVARLGGDEFAILQVGVDDPEDAAALARRTIAALAEPFLADAQEFRLSASIGITFHPRDGTDADELLRNADLAMYQAKEEGRDVFRFFAADMDRRAREAMALEGELRAALARGQFVVHYQPQVNLRTGRIVGAEALLRWHRPGGTLTRPGDFLALAEETGLIGPINEWVLRTACAEAAAWQREGLRPLRVSVNLSAVQFRKHDVRRLVVSALEASGLDPVLLDLELTEGILLENDETVAQVLRDLRRLGVRFSIDDFGTGYSSLNYIKNFPVDRLKIDQSFIRNLRTDPSDTAIVRAIINLGHSLGLGVIAEGVETVEQVTQLIAEGCDEIQGHYYSHPVGTQELQALVRRMNGVSAAPPRDRQAGDGADGDRGAP
ncbi:putative bifunctional diguanylate cyclase/phosphodiesterase [Caldovatus aquaticus]|uniref:EAL domain-containing protein n=1 Tax=Caldovatus aquaticus TaxID=2865671 RepID=A0ABS7EXG4_9PROT|nr:EAL domain-containing protein [Caldovatus aquaticus]MBW8268047.1 EAL domain-containing protein [Caldovatus aquaticus]